MASKKKPTKTVFHLLLDLPKPTREWKSAVEVLDTTSATNKEEAQAKFRAGPWFKAGAYVLSQDECDQDPRGPYV